MIEAALCVKVPARVIDPSSNGRREATPPGKTAHDCRSAPPSRCAYPQNIGRDAPPQLP
jgi:hypothetical protein